MSNRKNHRRGEERRTEHGPTWEGPNPGKGCNSTHVARARRWWSKFKSRVGRRTGRLSKFMGQGKPPPPKPPRPQKVVWRPLGWGDCYECGDAVDVALPLHRKIDAVFDGDTVRCVSCNWYGNVIADEDGIELTDGYLMDPALETT